MGTRLYMSPEQKAGGKYDEKVDMYALGVILFELNCPFRTTSEKSDVRMVASKHNCYDHHKLF